MTERSPTQPLPDLTVRPTIRAGYYSDKGSRHENEDSYALRNLSDGLVAIVADGMGGGIDGKLFSQRAVGRVSASIEVNRDQHDSVAQVEGAIFAAVQELAAMRQNEPRYAQSGSTLILARVRIVGSQVEATIGSIGDSRAYHVTASGAIHQLTRDHSYAETLIANGTPADQAYLHPQALRLTYSLGETTDLARVPNLITEPCPLILAAGDRLVLCTDGVYKALSGRDIALITLANPPEQAAKLLAERATSAGSRDNVTAVVIESVVPAFTPAARRRSPWVIAATLAFLLLGAGALAFSRGQTAPISTNLDDATVTALPVQPTNSSVPTVQASSAPATATNAPLIGTPTFTFTPTSTPTNTPTNTPTLVPTRTPTRTPTLVLSATITLIVTIPPTETLTPIVTATDVITPAIVLPATDTPAAQPLDTLTNTPVPQSLDTLTATPTDTPTPTETPPETPPDQPNP